MNDNHPLHRNHIQQTGPTVSDKPVHNVVFITSIFLAFHVFSVLPQALSSRYFRRCYPLSQFSALHHHRFRTLPRWRHGGRVHYRWGGSGDNRQLQIVAAGQYFVRIWTLLDYFLAIRFYLIRTKYTLVNYPDKQISNQPVTPNAKWLL